MDHNTNTDGATPAEPPASESYAVKQLAAAVIGALVTHQWIDDAKFAHGGYALLQKDISNALADKLPGVDTLDLVRTQDRRNR